MDKLKTLLQLIDVLHNARMLGITRDEIKKKSNAKNFDMHKYIEKSFGIYKSAHGPYDVECCVRPISKAEKYIFHPTQEKIKNKDGSLTIRFHADGLHKMDYLLFTWKNKPTLS